VEHLAPGLDRQPEPVAPELDTLDEVEEAVEQLVRPERLLVRARLDGAREAAEGLRGDRLDDLLLALDVLKRTFALDTRPSPRLKKTDIRFRYQERS
jgi:hypothetical protein